MIRRTTFCDSPARGGSTIRTSGRPARSTSSRMRQPHVAGEEVGVVDLVGARVGDRVGDRLGDQLEPPHLGHPRGHEQADRADPAVQVVDALEAGRRRRTRSPARTGARPSRCWSERTPPAEISKRIPPSSSSKRSEPASNSVSPPWVVSPDAALARPEQPVEAVGGRDQRLPVELPLAGDQAHLDRSAAPALAHDEVAQQALAGAPVIGGQALLAAPRDDLLAGRVGALGGEQAVGRWHDLVPAARGVKAAHQRAVGVGAERVLELVAIAPLRHARGRSARARSRRACRSVAARRRPARCLTSSWRS